MLSQSVLGVNYIDKMYDNESVGLERDGSVGFINVAASTNTSDYTDTYYRGDGKGAILVEDNISDGQVIYIGTEYMRSKGVYLPLESAFNVTNINYTVQANSVGYNDYGSGWRDIPVTFDNSSNLSATGEVYIEWSEPNQWQGIQFDNNPGIHGVWVRIMFHDNYTNIGTLKLENAPLAVNPNMVDIESGDDVRVQDVYDYLLSIDNDCIHHFNQSSSSYSEGSMTYYSQCNWRVQNNAKLNVDKGTFLQVGDHSTSGGMYANWKSIFLHRNGVVELGDLMADGDTRQGGTLSYGAGYRVPSNYHYWYGTVNVYDSVFVRNTGGFFGLSFAGDVTLIDSKMYSYNTGQIFFSGSSSLVVKDSEINNDWLYIYGDADFDGLVFEDASLTGGFIKGTLIQSDILQSLNIDGSPFTATSASYTFLTYYNANSACINCNFNNEQLGVSSLDRHKTDSLTFRELHLSVYDQYGNGLDNVSVELKTLEGRDGFMTYRKWYEHDYTVTSARNGVGDVWTDFMDNGTHYKVRCRDQELQPCANNYEVGDRLYHSIENVEVSRLVNDSYLWVEVLNESDYDNNTGIYAGQSRSAPFWHTDTLMTDANGTVKYKGNNPLLLELYKYDFLDADTEYFENEVFELRASKEGYQDLYYKFNVTELTGDDWRDKINVKLVLTQQPDSYNYVAISNDADNGLEIT
jgi:hypothetical protein